MINPDKHPLTVSLPATSIAGAVEFTLAAGQCLVVSGPSGVGKTTMLRKVADLDPHEGTISLGPERQFSLAGPTWRSKVTYVASESGWWEPTVGEHFQPEDAPRSLMRRLGIAVEKLESAPQTLSTGERQRMALIRALVKAPAFLLLDEPTSALDEQSTLDVEAALHDYKKSGGGLLVVTHDTAQGKRLANGHLILKRA